MARLSLAGGESQVPAEFSPRALGTDMTALLAGDADWLCVGWFRAVRSGRLTVACCGLGRTSCGGGSSTDYVFAAKGGPKKDRATAYKMLGVRSYAELGERLDSWAALAGDASFEVLSSADCTDSAPTDSKAIGSDFLRLPPSAILYLISGAHAILDTPTAMAAGGMDDSDTPDMGAPIALSSSAKM